MEVSKNGGLRIWDCGLRIEERRKVQGTGRKAEGSPSTCSGLSADKKQLGTLVIADLGRFEVFIIYQVGS